MDSVRHNEKLGKVSPNDVVEWVRSGRNRQDLADLHNRLYPKIRGFIASRVACPEDAEDLAQDVFVELHRNNGQHERIKDPEKYIFGIARNLVSQYYRKKSKSIKAIPIEEIGPLSASYGRRQQPGPETQAQKQELVEALEKVLARLPTKARQALKLRFTDGLPSEQAARKSGCSPVAFRKRIYRTIERIRLHFDGGMGGPER